MTNRLLDKKIIVTGGASGIGRAICELFASEGGVLVIADIDDDGGQETLQRILETGGRAIFEHTDVTEPRDVEALIIKSVEYMGGIDILVNDAAAFVFGGLEDVSNEDWEKVFSVNVIGSANMIKFAMPYLKVGNGPSVVNIASVSSFIAQPKFIPYNSSKGALLQMTKCLALDLSEYGIRVNCVCPGTIHTPATERHIKFEGADREVFLKEAAQGIFLKRLGKPIEVAYAALFLASDESSFITGEHLVVDGGATV